MVEKGKRAKTRAQACGDFSPFAKTSRASAALPPRARACCVAGMTPRVRRLLLAASLLGFAAGCAHRPPAPMAETSLAPDPAITRESALPPATRVTEPGTPFTRLEPGSPFDPRLVVTTQVAHGDLFLHAFTQEGPRYLSAARLYRGQYAYLLPFATNYGVAPDRRTDLTYEIDIRKADGSHDGTPFGAVLWQTPVSGPGLVLYPATTVNFHAEPDDPLGEYVITARITDHLTGETVAREHRLVLEDYAAPALPADFNAENWFNTYYQKPSPELALSVLPRLLLDVPADRRAAALPPVLGFYDQVLTDNAWLLPAFCARLAAADPDEAYALSLVLGHHLRASVAPPAGVDFASWVRLEDFRTHRWPSDPDAPLAQAAQLDALWGRFLASGLYTPVAGVLTSLANHADLGAADRWQKVRAEAGLPADLSPEGLAAAADPDFDAGEDAPPPDVLRDVLLRTAIWSLRGNASRHALVRSYLDWTLRVGDLPPAQKQLLSRILNPDTLAPAAGPATAVR